MELGAFSVSLSVSNIEESKAFYQKLGFEIVGGDQSQNWLILRNGDHTIGLFQGMFEGDFGGILCDKEPLAKKATFLSDFSIASKIDSPTTFDSSKPASYNQPAIEIALTLSGSAK